MASLLLLRRNGSLPVAVLAANGLGCSLSRAVVRGLSSRARLDLADGLDLPVTGRFAHPTLDTTPEMRQASHAWVVPVGAGLIRLLARHERAMMTACPHANCTSAA
jgi:hypothetical protein